MCDLLCDEHQHEVIESCPICDLEDIRSRYEAMNASYQKLIERADVDQQATIDQLMKDNQRLMKLIRDRDEIIISLSRSVSGLTNVIQG